ncbi:hypothetical protein [Rhizobium leguminosarum]|uniref:hypothetical protein n=1 Tax=Rhizobium leguminosarum TaxID=384 RepID=UPI001C976261|nr:hypothetical protein [Rhizobium leguminosarum]MBY5581854.1 hypothetical protein [Rhizobium leguminosarum]
MAVQAFIIMDQTQRDAAEALNDMDAILGARQVDNPLSNNLGSGTLVGKWVSPARLLNDPAYQRWVPTLGGLPIAVMDSETIFAPVEEA